MSESPGYLTVKRIREIEQRGLASLPAGTLMRRAAEAVAGRADLLLQDMDPRACAIGLVGPGNNGGDALVALLLLAARGYRVAAYSSGTDRPVVPDAATACQNWLDAGHGLERLADLPARLASAEHDHLLIDGLFGIGLARPLGGDIARIADLTHRVNCPVLAIDVPSGVDADTGSVIGGPRAAAVRATCTVTMIADKPGLHTGRGVELAGDIEVAPLGLTAASIDGLRIDRAWVTGRLQPRRRDAHKGHFGTIVVLGGGAGMTGAALLAGQAARAVGAGKVALLGPDGPVFDPGEPQLMAWALERPADLDTHLGKATAAVMGCGLGTQLGARNLLARALAQEVPAVLDADGINLVAQADAGSGLQTILRDRARRKATVLTPHPLEAARLLQCTVERIESDRLAAARTAAAMFGVTVLLKGPGTVLAAPDGRWALIDSGNPALATAGTGDILAGMVGGLLAQGHSAWEAGAIGAWVHGDAADRWRVGQSRGIGLSSRALFEAIVTSINEC